MIDKAAGLYIHIPFCIQKCTYCDFYSTQNKDIFTPYHNNRPFIERLIQDMLFFKQQYGIKYWETVYIGGGTPSILSAEDIYMLCTAITHSQHQAVREFTIEANPEDIDEEWLTACRRGGVTRLSLGIQSLDDTVLSGCGRRGSRKKTLAALNTVKSCWKGILSCDLIAGLSGQTREGHLDDIRILTEYYNVHHLSVYGLCSHAELTEQHDDAIADMLEAGRKLLREKQYHQYEVSNFSYKNEYKSIHNERYWKMQSYIGIGPASVGTLVHEDTGTGVFREAERFACTTDVQHWYTEANRLSVYTQENISRHTFLEEVFLMGFRLLEGISRMSFMHRFGNDMLYYIGRTVSKWEKKGLCTVTPDSICLTAEGLLFLNSFLVDIFSELETTNSLER